MAGCVVSSILSISRLVAAIGQSSSSTSTDPRNIIEEDLRKLVRNLERIQAVLHDAEEREIRDKSVKLWLWELRGVAYNAEDVLDEYHYELLRSKVEDRAAAAKATRKRKLAEEGEEDQQQQVHDFPSTTSSSSNASIWDGMGDKIREIRVRFDEIARDRDALHLRSEDGEKRFECITYQPQSGSLVDNSCVFGREDDKKKVIELLFSDVGCRFSVIPIVGMGGLGKTTLAQLIYNDPNICSHFNLRGWVSVSADFDVPRLTRAIIESISKAPCDLTELSSLQDTLRKEVEEKSVLLVLDDVWTEKRRLWESLTVALLAGRWVRVIVTTRNSSVTEIMQTVPPYTLRGLHEDECRMLFRRYAFGAENPAETHEELVEMCDKIVEKCDGLPLAVKALGCLLAGETDIERWNEIRESDIWELDQMEDEILPALRLSYIRLPTALKPCFVYCSMFRKSYQFQKYELIKQWMAQGYIQPRGSRSLEDIGSVYFDQLLRRSFFQISNEGYVIHDLMVDLARSISKGERCTKTLREVRHLCVENKEDANQVLENLSSYRKPTTLRTLFVPESYGCTLPFIRPLMKFLNLGYLRALSWVSIECLPDSIGGMKHLRYLGLDCSHVDLLPESLCQWYNLQILKLRTNQSLIRELPGNIGSLINLRELYLDCSNQIKTFPESFCQLHNLRRLDITFCNGLEVLPSGLGDLINLRELYLPYGFPETYCPTGMGKLTNLRSLSRFKVTRCIKIGELNGLAKLTGKLDIGGLQNVGSASEAKQANLKGKPHIEKLNLTWTYRADAVLDEELDAAVLENLRPHPNLQELTINQYRGPRLPSWMVDPSFSKLTTVRLSLYGNISMVCLPPLGQLPALRFLTLKHISGIRCIGHEFSCGFPSLKELEFVRMAKLEKWEGVQDGDFPHLEFLNIYDCHKLRSLPTIPLLQSQTLQIIQCSSLRTIPLQQNSGRPSRLQNLHIEDCRRLSSVMGLHTIDSLEKLKIELCPELQFLSGGPPSKLQELQLKDSRTLISIGRLQNPISLGRLHSERCLRLQSRPDEWLPSRPERGETIDPSRLKEWCQRHNFTYFEVCFCSGFRRMVNMDPTQITR